MALKKAEPKPPPKPKLGLEAVLEEAGVDVKQAKADAPKAFDLSGDLAHGPFDTFSSKHFGGRFYRRLAEALAKNWK